MANNCTSESITAALIATSIRPEDLAASICVEDVLAVAADEDIKLPEAEMRKKELPKRQARQDELHRAGIFLDLEVVQTASIRRLRAELKNAGLAHLYTLCMWFRRKYGNRNSATKFRQRMKDVQSKIKGERLM